MQRPDFQNIKTYQEFSKYYWYRDELIQICKVLGVDYQGSKLELNHNIEEYFKGNLVKKRKSGNKARPITSLLTLDTKLLDCGFCFNQKFRDFFSEQAGSNHFKFNTDMVPTAKKVKQDQDTDFTLQDMLDVYYGKREYARYDKSSCQWNQFLKDFCVDQENVVYTSKLKVASILWEEVRNSTREKVYSKDLLVLYKDKIKNYRGGCRSLP
ncbi:MAG TPA: SAP domain-containing protein [Lachnospiraceae bacterium]|nr:SAP domain-containing protein [Lachnospiraceae bacterium]